MWTLLDMAVQKGSVFVIVFLCVVSVPELSCASDVHYVTAACSQEVPIATADHDQIAVNVTFSQPQPSGATCSWVIPARNSSMSNTILLVSAANADALACDKNAFSVSEKNPQSNALNPLTLECMAKSVNPNLTRYKPVIGQPGFPIVVTLNTTSALSENFFFMYVFPFVWTEDVCPRKERKVIIAQPGSKDKSETLTPASLLGRYPDNFVCKWEFRAPDEGVVHLQLRTFGYKSDSAQRCGGGDHFVVSDKNSTSGPVIIPLCQNPGVFFDHTSTTGSVQVNLVSDSSGGAYQSFYIKYWSIPSCPHTPLKLSAYVGEKYRFKGSSFSLQGAGQDQQCRWKVTTSRSSVIKLYQLEAPQFQTNCNDSKDYLMVNTQKVSICNSSSFPVWSEGEAMDITFHTNTEQLRRSFLLRFTAVYKSPCQGHPERKTVVGSTYRGDYVRLMPIPQGDIRNGLVCQWIFSAKEKENAVQLIVKWAERGSSTEDSGVPFDRDACSFSGFEVFSGVRANSSARVMPSCPEDKASIRYTSSSRSMLFVYRRPSLAADPGFPMEVNQVRATASKASEGREVSLLVWRTMILGLCAVVLL